LAETFKIRWWLWRGEYSAIRHFTHYGKRIFIKEQLEKFKAELEQLKNVKRNEVASV